MTAPRDQERIEPKMSRNIPNPGELMSLSKAAAALSVSRGVVTALIARNRLTEYTYELDRRTRFVLRADVERLAATTITEVTAEHGPWRRGKPRDQSA